MLSTYYDKLNHITIYTENIKRSFYLCMCVWCIYRMIHTVFSCADKISKYFCFISATTTETNDRPQECTN